MFVVSVQDTVGPVQVTALEELTVPQPPGLQVLLVSVHDTVGPVQVVVVDSEIAPQLFAGVHPAV